MATVSRDTFNKLKHYVSLRLQMGVPVVDADINELEDIRRYELQAFLKWFVGNGVPHGNNGYAIKPISGTNIDFKITGGSGGDTDDEKAINAGRCFVEGWDAINETDLNYTDQKLFDSTLATEYGVAPLTGLHPATADRDDIVYLDIWEREVTAGEIGQNQDIYDRSIVNEDIGVETCTRKKREWVVRVTEGSTSLPVEGDDEYRGDHVYYELARIKWTLESDGTIVSREIIDKRLTGLTIGSYNDTQQIIRDSFGDNYSLDRDGHPNLKVSLREAINALLRGNIPSTPAAKFTEDEHDNRQPQIVQDHNGDIVVFWVSTRLVNGNTDTNIYCKRRDHLTGLWVSEEKLTTATNPASDTLPVVITDSEGGIWLFWVSDRDGNKNIYCKHHHQTEGWRSEEEARTTDVSSDTNPAATVDQDGNIWVFWVSDRSAEGSQIYYQRRNKVTGNWESADNPLPLPQGPLFVKPDGNPFVVSDDSERKIWVFWTALVNVAASDYQIFSAWRSIDDTSPDWTIQSLSESSYVVHDPFAVVDSIGDIWSFWTTERQAFKEIFYNRYNRVDGSWVYDEGEQLDDETTGHSPAAYLDNEGGIWVFWISNGLGNDDIWYKRNKEGWTIEQKLTSTDGEHACLSALNALDGDLWLVWQVVEGSKHSVWYRTIVPVI